MPTAILSDIHGNSPALEAVLEDVERCGCAEVFILGDIINGVDPQGTMTLVRGLGSRAACIKGNAEFYTLTPNLGELPDKDDLFNLIPLVNYFRDHLTPDDLAWLAALPDHLMWQGACLVHDSPLDRFYPERWHIPGIADEYQEWYFHSMGIREKMPEHEWAEIWAWMEAQAVWGVFCGHWHAPFLRRKGQQVVCNVGGAGFTLDGDPRPSWAMVSGEPGPGCSIEIRRVAYDIDRTVRMMREHPAYLAWEGAEKNAAYLKMLQTGIHWKDHLKG